MGTKLLYDATKVDMEIDEKPKKITPDEFTQNQPMESAPEEVVTKEEETIEETTVPTTPLDYVDHDDSLELFGFLENADIAKTRRPNR